jgi:hypothetical protein
MGSPTPLQLRAAVGVGRQRAAKAALRGLIRTTCLPAVILPRTAAPVAAITATARSAICFGTGFIDGQRSSVELFAAQYLNGALSLSIDAHFDKAKPSLAPCISVRCDTHTADGSELLKHGSQSPFGRIEAEVSHKNIFHVHFLSEVAER